MEVRHVVHYESRVEAEVRYVTLSEGWSVGGS